MSHLLLRSVFVAAFGLAGLLPAVALPAQPAGVAAPAPGPALQAAPADRNPECPVTEGEAIDPAVSSVYEGKTVYFCCKRCLRSFEKDPAAYREDLARVWPAAFAMADGISPAEARSADAPERSASSAPEALEIGEGHPHPTGADEADAGDADHDHEHEHHAEAAGLAERLRVWIGGFHPPSTHFPVALLIFAGTLELWLMRSDRGRALLRPTITVTATAGAAAAVGVAALGWFNGGFHLTDAKLLTAFHRWLGTGTAMWAMVLLVPALRCWTRPTPPAAFRPLLLIGALLVAVTGFLGGALVFGLDHLMP